MKKLFSGIFSFLLPSPIAIFTLRLLGHKISYKSKISFSFLFCDKISIDENAFIGNGNYIKCDELQIGKGGIIGKLNFIKGPFSVFLDDEGAIGNTNKISRAGFGISSGTSKLSIGKFSKITANHRLDLIKPITIGQYSIIAGSSCQLWTHGYYHYPVGPDRFRIDGEIIIGDNVYIGSNSVINAGVRIGNAISVGSNSSVSKSILKSGLYVAQPLRYIEMNMEKIKGRLRKCDDYC